MQEVCLHTGKSFIASEAGEIQVMLSQVIKPTFCRTGQADLSLWQSYHKSNIYQWFCFTCHKRSSGKLSMYLLTASHGHTQTISSVVLSNANAALSVLTALRLGQFSNTAKLKEDEISSGTLLLKCTITQSAPGQMWVIVFPALTLPGVCSVCYWCPGSFSITDKRFDPHLEIFLAVKL